MLSYNVNILYNKIYKITTWEKLAKISVFEAIEPHLPSLPSPILFYSSCHRNNTLEGGGYHSHTLQFYYE